MPGSVARVALRDCRTRHRDRQTRNCGCQFRHLPLPFSRFPRSSAAPREYDTAQVCLYEPLQKQETLFIGIVIPIFAYHVLYYAFLLQLQHCKLLFKVRGFRGGILAILQSALYTPQQLIVGYQGKCTTCPFESIFRITALRAGFRFLPCKFR